MVRPRSFINIALLLVALLAKANAADLGCAKADTQAALNLCAIKELSEADKVNVLKRILDCKMGDFTCPRLTR